MTDIVIIAIIGMAMAVIVRKKINDHKTGKGGCGCGGCSNCNGCGSCPSNNPVR